MIQKAPSHSDGIVEDCLDDCAVGADNGVRGQLLQDVPQLRPRAATCEPRVFDDRQSERLREWSHRVDTAPVGAREDLARDEVVHHGGGEAGGNGLAVTVETALEVLCWIRDLRASTGVPQQQEPFDRSHSTPSCRGFGPR